MLHARWDSLLFWLFHALLCPCFLHMMMVLHLSLILSNYYLRWTPPNIAIEIIIAMRSSLLLKSSLLWKSSYWNYTCLSLSWKDSWVYYLLMKFLSTSMHTLVYASHVFHNCLWWILLFMHKSAIDIPWKDCWNILFMDLWHVMCEGRPSFILVVLKNDE